MLYLLLHTEYLHPNTHEIVGLTMAQRGEFWRRIQKSTLPMLLMADAGAHPSFGRGCPAKEAMPCYAQFRKARSREQYELHAGPATRNVLFPFSGTGTPRRRRPPNGSPRADPQLPALPPSTALSCRRPVNILRPWSAGGAMSQIPCGQYVIRESSFTTTDQKKKRRKVWK